MLIVMVPTQFNDSQHEDTMHKIKYAPLSKNSTQCNSSQHNDTQHNNVTECCHCIVMLSLVILNASQQDNITHCGNFYSYDEYRNTECTYAEYRFVIKCKKLIMLSGVGSPERHYAQCHYAELRYAEHQ
jgi:hypothetical protein